MFILIIFYNSITYILLIESSYYAMIFKGVIRESSGSHQGLSPWWLPDDSLPGLCDRQVMNMHNQRSIRLSTR